MSNCTEDIFGTVPNHATTKTPTITEIKQSMADCRAAMESLPKPVEVVLLTDDEFTELLWKLDGIGGNPSTIKSLYGIPVETYRTKELVKARAILLKEEGHRFLMVDDEGFTEQLEGPA